MVTATRTIASGTTMRRMEASLNAILREEGLTFFEALMLAAIFFEKKGGIKPSDLAETFQTTRGNVSHCVSSLEAKGLVRVELTIFGRPVPVELEYWQVDHQ